MILVCGRLSQFHNLKWPDPTPLALTMAFGILKCDFTIIVQTRLALTDTFRQHNTF